MADYLLTEDSVSCNQLPSNSSPLTALSCESGNRWFAAHTRYRHERKIASLLSDRYIHSFVPAVRETHRWSDRSKSVEVPLFPCYIFLRVKEWREVHQWISRIPGVFQWVTLHGEPAQIPDSEIEAVRKLLNVGVDITPYPFLQMGRRVRIRGGCLEGS